jgi:hypothetical protein
MAESTSAPSPSDVARDQSLTSFRRRFCGGALIAAAALIVAGELVSPQHGNLSTGAQAQLYATHPTSTQLSAVLMHFGALLVLPGLVGLLGLTRLRAVHLAHVGTSLAFLGFASLSGNLLVDFFTLSAGQELSHARATSYLEATSQLPGAAFFIVPAFAASFLGLIVMFIALGRAGELSWIWVAVTIVGIVLLIAAPIHVVTVAGFVAMSVGLAAAGARLLRT